MEELDKDKIIAKIGEFDTIEILVDDKQEMLFDGIIDAEYIYKHFRRIMNTSRHFNIIKLMGHHGRRSKEMIAEVIVRNEE